MAVTSPAGIRANTASMSTRRVLGCFRRLLASSSPSSTGRKILTHTRNLERRCDDRAKVSRFDLRRKCKLLDERGRGRRRRAFDFATTLVTGNEERHKINLLESQRLGISPRLAFGEMAQRGQLSRLEGKAKVRGATSNKRCRPNESFYELFVPGARAFLTHNINTVVGLANGTEVKYDSISFDDPDDEREYHTLMNRLQPWRDELRSTSLLVPSMSSFSPTWPGDSEAQKKQQCRQETQLATRVSGAERSSHCHSHLHQVWQLH